MVDTADSKSAAFGRGSSSLPWGTNKKDQTLSGLFYWCHLRQGGADRKGRVQAVATQEQDAVHAKLVKNSRHCLVFFIGATEGTPSRKRPSGTFSLLNKHLGSRE